MIPLFVVVRMTHGRVGPFGIWLPLFLLWVLLLPLALLLLPIFAIACWIGKVSVRYALGSLLEILVQFKGIYVEVTRAKNTIQISVR